LLLATNTIPLDSQIIQRAEELEAVGYGAFDALHLSSAEAGNAEVLLTTDDRFIKRATRAVGSPRVRVLNPVEWLREQPV
jgi:predicted nucleic acid-binding protein